MSWIKIKQNNNYSINKNGDIRNDQNGYIKKPFLNKQNGYLYVDLYSNNKSVKRPVHRLVAEAFIDNPEGKPCIDHKDGNRTNNSISNLRWASFAENNSRFETVGVRSEAITVTHYAEKRKKRGGGHEEWLGSDYTVEFDRITDAAKYFNVSLGNISLMLSKGTIGARGKMRGFKFEYKSGERKCHTKV